jgi:predicted nucleotide-binding protein
MGDPEPDARIKRLCYVLLKTGLERFLIGREIDLMLLKHDLDMNWRNIHQRVVNESAVNILVPGYTGYAEETFKRLLNILFLTKDKRFLTLIDDVLLEFSADKNLDNHIADIRVALLDVGMDEKRISRMKIMESKKTEYYHVRVHDEEDKPRFEFNLSLEVLNNKIIQPMVQGSVISFDGYSIDPGKLKRVKIYKTVRTPQHLTPKANLTNEFILWDSVKKHGKDITDTLLRETRKKGQKIPIKVLSNKVFIVHGHDDVAKLELARMLEKELNVDAIILHEQADGGRTIIEKLEGESNLESLYAIVLLTPDDVGTANKAFRSKADLKPRARQNVILELGFFLGKLGRGRVCCLYTGNVEIPSDMHGVLYKPFIKSVRECLPDIIKELRHAGFEVRL